MNDTNEWQDIENYINSFCGNSYHSVQILPRYYQIYRAPIMKGNFKTSFRFRLGLKDTLIYSNEYSGTINKVQFLKPEKYTKQE